MAQSELSCHPRESGDPAVACSALDRPSRETVTEQRFLADVLRNPNNEVILRRLPELGLPDGCLVAGALFQTVWNSLTQRPVGDGIKDYDVFYFDGADLSADSEARANERAHDLFDDLGIAIEVCNQARVHLWYERHFGYSKQPLTSVVAGIASFLVRCTCVGLMPRDGAEVEVIAPYGLDDLYAGRLVRNSPSAEPELFQRKVASYVLRWPHLTVAVSS